VGGRALTCSRGRSAGRWTAPGYPQDISPLRRQGEAPDMAEGVLFLVSDESNYVTGTVLDVNGGCLMD
jgi:NAD(P)-dependent dehydrogenase (short-subunit alcohol dehydrogenase family)